MPILHTLRVLGRRLFVGTLIGVTLLLTPASGEPQTTRRVTDPQQTDPAPRVRVARTRVRDPQPTPPQARIVANKSNPIQLGESVEFRLEPEGLVARSHYTYEVDYGDGEKETISRNLQFVQHRYKSAGLYRVSVNVLPVAGLRPAPPIGSITVQVVRMRFSVTPQGTEMGVPVLLKASSAAKDRNLRYRFIYGDGTQSSWQDSDETQHVYSVDGNFTARAEIAFADSPDPVDSVSQVITVKAVAPSSVTFLASPARVEAGEQVTLSARFDARGRQIQYRFVYDDGTESNWQDHPQLTHSYEGKPTRQTYRPYVKVGFLLDGQLNPLVDSQTKTVQVAAAQTRSNPSTPTPTPTVVDPRPPPDWVKILAFIALGLLVIGTLVGLSRAVKNRFSRPKPTFVAHADVGTASVVQTSAKHLIDFEVLVDPNLRGGSHRVILAGPVLVRDPRRNP